MPIYADSKVASINKPESLNRLGNKQKASIPWNTVSIDYSINTSLERIAAENSQTMEGTIIDVQSKGPEEIETTTKLEKLIREMLTKKEVCNIL